MDVRDVQRCRPPQGFSLVSLLMMVVILGGLAAVSIVGVSSMTGGGTAGVIGKVTTSTRPRPARTTSTTGRGAGMASVGVSSGGGISALGACKVSADAAGTASTLYVAAGGGSYPVKWSDLTSAQPPLFKLPTNVTINPADPAELDGRGWRLMMDGGGTRAPTFACSS